MHALIHSVLLQLSLSSATDQSIITASGSLRNHWCCTYALSSVLPKDKDVLFRFRSLLLNNVHLIQSLNNLVLRPTLLSRWENRGTAAERSFFTSEFGHLAASNNKAPLPASSSSTARAKAQKRQQAVSSGRDAAQVS